MESRGVVTQEGVSKKGAGSKKNSLSWSKSSIERLRQQNACVAQEQNCPPNSMQTEIAGSWVESPERNLQSLCCRRIIGGREALQVGRQK